MDTTFGQTKTSDGELPQKWGYASLFKIKADKVPPLSLSINKSLYIWKNKKNSRKYMAFCKCLSIFSFYWIYQLISTYQRECSGLFRCRLNGWVILWFSGTYFIRSSLPYYRYVSLVLERSPEKILMQTPRSMLPFLWESV